ncbi:family 16 glycosylhydrolase [Catenovulum maritimum]|uniref:glycoside hydrolase family 16 protein n=1 Tax=Catenovulum maritimum TaxID=1513271 RepID=UPI00069FAA34|nr:glycoside hydrolase family 16 protein [Catenovulum maritimum]
MTHLKFTVLISSLSALVLIGISSCSGIKTAKWELVWQDEFDGASLDLSKWNYEENCWGGGNNEQQCYTNKPDNAYVKDGVLNIVAKKETFTGPAHVDGNMSDSKTLPYTSARLNTKHKADWTYGRFEISAKLPQGQGTWPAIWMLPTDNVYGTWAASGEIDIMEAVNINTASDAPEAEQGALETRIHGTLHFGRNWPENVHSGTSYTLPNSQDPSSDFHQYAVEWEPGEIRWYVDNIHYATQTSAGWYTQYPDQAGKLVNGSADAPFNQNFHILLNLAVGGAWAANTNNKGIDPSVFPQTLAIDYVRVYQCSDQHNCGTKNLKIKPLKGLSAPAL